MNCPICGGKTIVTNSRKMKDVLYVVKRKRECTNCFTVFSTRETLVRNSISEYLLNRVKV